ncbi:MAG: response regulator [Porticoccaceae bacterium]
MTEEKSHILLVDDDTGLTSLLTEYLSQQDFSVASAANAHAAIKHLESGSRADLVVLDIMMPGMSGLELLSVIRARWQIPVIMLTGRGEDIDRILGLEMGADDYLGKPCNPRELAARIRAVLRRANADTVAPTIAADIEIGDIVLRRGSRSVTVSGERVAFTTAEFDVLAELMNDAGNVVSREHLTQAVLHRELSPYDRSIDVHVSRVRNALRQCLPDKELIVTIRGVGYQFVRS